MKSPLIIAATIVGLASASQDNVTTLNAPEPAEFYACRHYTLENNIFDVKGVTVDPNPPKKGRDVHVAVRGHLNETVAQGAYVKATIKKGALKHTLTFDFCKGIGSGCPVAAGDVEFWSGQYIAKTTPSGKAKIQFRSYTADGRSMGCVDVLINLVKA